MTTTDPLPAMRRNLRMAVGGAAVPSGIVVPSPALDIAAKLAACSMAEDLRVIRQLLEVILGGAVQIGEIREGGVSA